MSRSSGTRNTKKYIIAFWEGDSEKIYLNFLRNKFKDILTISIYSKNGTFDTAKKAFSNLGQYKDDITVVDEIWFMFDTEVEHRSKWTRYSKIMKKLNGSKKHNIDVKLFMTKGCIEYFFLLHYIRKKPQIVTAEDKKAVMNELKRFCLDYEKTNKAAIDRISLNYPVVIKNGKWTLAEMKNELKTVNDNITKEQILFQTDTTFTNAHEAIEYLLELQKEYTNHTN